MEERPGGFATFWGRHVGRVGQLVDAADERERAEERIVDPGETGVDEPGRLEHQEGAAVERPNGGFDRIREAEAVVARGDRLVRFRERQFPRRVRGGVERPLERRPDVRGCIQPGERGAEPFRVRRVWPFEKEAQPNHPGGGTPACPVDEASIQDEEEILPENVFRDRCALGRALGSESPQALDQIPGTDQPRRFDIDQSIRSPEDRNVLALKDETS
jgi:hypothetical protein